MRAGTKTYLGRACRRCGHVLRYQVSRGCVNCHNAPNPQGVSPEVQQALTKLSCSYCGGAGGPNIPVLRDTGRDWVGGNVVYCCHWCARAKWTRTEADFIAWVMRIAKKLRGAS